MALVGVVRVVAGVGSAVVWIGVTMVGVTAALVIFLGVVLVWALPAMAHPSRAASTVTVTVASLLCILLVGIGLLGH